MNAMKQLSWLPLLLLLTAPAAAASSTWFETPGGAIRIVTNDLAEGGILRGALEIRLEPGWKTYWMDPGDAGVPPQIDLGASRDVAGIRILYPPPKRFDDGYSHWAGYDENVALALEFETGAAPHIIAEVFLGICQTICIPVSASLAVDPGRQSDMADARIVERAFTRLPLPANESFGLDRVHADGKDRLRVGTRLPRSVEGEPELFLGGAEGWQFGVPVFESGESPGNVFTIPVLERPGNPQPASVSYTLVAGESAVTGVLVIPAGQE